MKVIRTTFVSIVVIISMFVPMFSHHTFAAVPQFINYQSRLRDSSSNAVTTATTIQFSIYNHATNGSPSDSTSSDGPLLWTETYSQGSGSCIRVDPDSDGYFTVQLGTCNGFPSYLDFNSIPLYIGVKIGNDAEATPRAHLGTAPFAFNTDTLDSIDSLSFLRSDTSDVFTSGTLTFNDSTILSFGSSNDFTISHDGTNTIFDNTFATGASIFQLGADTNAVAFQILNNTGDNLFEVDGAGNVGIGTAGPDRKLDILDSTSPQLRLTQTDGSVYADFQVNSNGDLLINVDGQSNQLVLDNEGNVGIGTAEPDYNLQVFNSSQAVFGLKTGGSGDGTWAIVADAGVELSPGLDEVRSFTSFNGDIYAGTSGSSGDAEIYRSSDDGATWTRVAYAGDGDISSGLSEIVSLTIFGNKIYAGTRPAQIYSSSDGTNWELETTLSGFEQVLSFGIFGNKIYAGTGFIDAAEIHSSSDGTIWEKVASSGAELASGLWRVYSFESFGGKIYVAVAGGLGAAKIYSSDNGITWVLVATAGNELSGDQIENELSSNLIELETLTTFDSKLYVGGGGASDAEIYESPDGTTWTLVAQDDIDFDISDNSSSITTLRSFNNKLYAGTNNYGDIYESSDGTNWTESSYSGSYVYSIFDFNGEIYAGDGNGAEIYKLGPTDATATFTLSDTGKLTISSTGGVQIGSNSFYYDARSSRYGINTKSPDYDFDIVGTFSSTGETILARESGNVGIGTMSPVYPLDILSTSTSQLALTYDTSNYSTFWVDSGGDLTITSTGGTIAFAGTLDPSSVAAFTLSGDITGTGSPNLSALGVVTASTLSAINFTLGSDTLTNITGTGLSVSGGNLNWSASGISGHDTFTDFVADEHLDWTTGSAGTIHIDNYIENPFGSEIGAAELAAAEDFGDFTCDGDAGGCTLDISYLPLTGGTVSGSLDVATLSINSVYTFPGYDGTPSQILSTDGNGNLIWAADTDTDTTYTAGTNLSLNGTQFNLDSNLSALGTVTASTLSAINFTLGSDTLTNITGTGLSVSGGNLNWSASGISGHDTFTDFVADEHLDHTGVTLTAGTGLSGGGDISANRTFTFDATELTNLTWSAGGSSTFTHTYNVQTGTDPVLTFGDNYINLSTGRLGIGDASPDALLEIVSSGNNDLFMLSKTEGGDGDAFIVDNEGNVGIGINSPLSELTIKRGSPTKTPGNIQDMMSIVGRATDDTDDFRAARYVAERNATSDSSTKTHGLNAFAYDYGSVNLTNSMALVGQRARAAKMASGGTIKSARAFSGEVDFHQQSPAITGTITEAIIFAAEPIDAEHGNILNAYSFYGEAHQVNTGNPSGTLFNAVGMWLEKQTVGTTTNYGLVLEGDGAGADIVFGADQDANIYWDGSALVLNGSNVSISGLGGFGDTTPEAVLEVTTNGEADAYFMVSSNAAGDGDYFIVDSSGNVGIGDSTPRFPLEVLSVTTAQLALTYNGSNYAYFQVDSGGDLTITTTGGTIFTSGTLDPANVAAFTLTGDITGSGSPNLSALGTVIASTLSTITFILGSDEITDIAGTGLSVSGGTLNWSASGISGHNTFTDFVANEHLDHTGVTLTAGTGLSGGGDISANRTFTFDATELTNLTWSAGGSSTFTHTYNVQTGTDPVLTFGDNYINLSTGRLGIGDASPDALLEIVSSGNNDLFMLSKTEGGDGDYFIVDSSGNVGIGVRDPDTTLEILNAGNQLKLSFDGTDNTIFAVDTNGVLTITPSGATVNFGGSIGATGTRITKGWFTDLEVTNAIAAAVTGNAATATALETARNINGVSFDGTANITVTADANTLTNTTLKSTVVTSSLTSVGTLTTLQVDNININGNTISSTAGTNLLITPLAGQQLVLDGTIVIDAGIVTGAASLDLGGTTLYASRAITVDTGGVLNIVLASAAGDDFTIDTSKLVVEGDTGNVGIGTTSPSELLDVAGTAEITGQLTTGNSQYDTAGNLVTRGTGRDLFIIQTSDNAQDAGIAFRNYVGAYSNVIYRTNIGSNQADLRIAGGSATTTITDLDDYVTIKGGTGSTAGYVGIGTTSPNQLLEVYGASAIIRLNDDGTDYVDLKVQGDGDFIIILNSGSGGGGKKALYDGGLAWSFPSDQRLKTGIENAEPFLSKVMQLKVRRFDWIGEEPRERKELGLIAQEVEPYFPEIVGNIEDPKFEDGIKTLGYSAFGVIALKAVQELNLNFEGILSTTTESSTSESKFFATRFFSSLFNRIINWFADKANGIKSVFADVFYAKEKICVDGECLTKDDIRKILELTRGQTAAPTENTVSQPLPDTPAGEAELLPDIPPIIETTTPSDQPVFEPEPVEEIIEEIIEGEIIEEEVAEEPELEPEPEVLEESIIEEIQVDNEPQIEDILPEETILDEDDITLELQEEEPVISSEESEETFPDAE